MASLLASPRSPNRRRAPILATVALRPWASGRVQADSSPTSLPSQQDNSSAEKKRRPILTRILLAAASLLARSLILALLRTALPPAAPRRLAAVSAAALTVYNPALVLEPIAALAVYRWTAQLVAPAHARSLDFWARVIPIYLAYKQTQVRTLRLPVGSDERDKLWARRHHWGANEVYLMCTELRGYFLKNGQYLGSRGDFVPDAWVSKMATLQDKVPPIPVEQVEKTLCEAFSISSSRQIFSRLDPEPLASATIAQVHRAAVRSDNQEVVVKAQYADQERLCALDLLNLKRLVKFLQSFDMNFFDMNSVVEEFETQIPKEFDFEREARSQATIYTNLTKAGIAPRRLIVPALQPGLTARKALVMEYIDGCKVDDLKTLAEWHIRPKTIVSYIAEAFGQMMLVDGIFHSDPHPGNLLVTRDGRVALIDYGQCKSLTSKDRTALCHFYLAMSSGNVSRIAQTFRDLGIVLDLDPLDPKADEITAVYATGLLDTSPLPDGVEIDPFSENSPLRQAAIKVFPQSLFMVLRTMGLLRALTVSLDVECNMCWLFRGFARAGLRRP